MFRRTKYTALVLAGVLAMTLAFDGVATAKITIQPTVTIGAVKSGPQAITVHGVYHNKSFVCRLVGRPVSIFINAIFRAQVFTGAGGLYGPRKLFAHHGNHFVQSKVPGAVRGGYGSTYICLDAVSRVASVRV